MLDKTDDIAVAAEHWLAQFEAALSGADFRALAHLFLADSYWRDVLAFSWTLQTWNGADAILSELKALAPRSARGGPDCFLRIERRMACDFIEQFAHAASGLVSSG